MLFQNHKLFLTACTSLAIVGVSLGGAHASETTLNTDTVYFQGQEYRYPPADVLQQPVRQTRQAPVQYRKTITPAQNVNHNQTRVAPQVLRRPMMGNYRPPNQRPYNAPVSRPPVAVPGNRYPAHPYNARPPVAYGPTANTGIVPPPYAGRNYPGKVVAPPPPPPPARPGYTPPPPRPAGAPPLNPPFAGPNNRPGMTPGNRYGSPSSDVVISDPDIPEEYAKNPYINGSFKNNPPPPVNNPNINRRGGKGPFKNMGFGPFNGNDAPWETWPFGGRDSFWSRKEFPFKRQSPGDWFNPGDPKEGLAIMWDDLISAPDDLGTMPGGWTVPSVSVPNPVDLEDQLEKASKEVPDLIRVYTDD